MPDVLCMIPVRGGSKRFPGKNVAPLLGKPLLAYAVEAARSSEVFDTICVTSDNDEYLGIARACGADLTLKRTPELASDSAQVKDVCLHLIEQLAAGGKRFDEFAVLLATNPLRTADDIRNAYRMLRTEDADYVMSVVPFSHPPQRAVSIRNGYLQPFFGIGNMKPTQYLEPLYRHDGSLIFAKTDVFLREKQFYGEKVRAFVIPEERSVDIDNPLDLKWAEFILKR
jgi:CMP-N-acetylneuraminic acid synthetase